MMIQGRDRELNLPLHIISVCDDGGADGLLSFSDEEAVALFREWLVEAREREAQRCAQIAIERAAELRAAERAAMRAKLALVAGAA